MKTTLNKIKSHGPCEDGWKTLLKHLGKTASDDDELTIRRILESNGIADAIWALRSVDGHDREIRLFAADCAESVLYLFERDYPNEGRPRQAIEAARKYADGLISKQELFFASAAASAAASDAAWNAASAAASAAAWAAENEKQKELLLKYL